MTLTKKLGFALMALTLVGCAANEQELAQSGDWYQIGYQDGIAGHTQRSYRSLSQLGSVDKSDYDQGYLEGVAEYCNPDFAYQIGLSGQYYEGVCDGTEEALKFRMEWQRGWNDYSQY